MSIILLLGMIGAIILTADNYHEVRVINLYKKNKKSSILMPFLKKIVILVSFVKINSNYHCSGCKIRL